LPMCLSFVSAMGDSCTTQPIEDSQRKLAVRSWASNKVGLC
jgi:hypothetical protein